ncbi:hypothetical protein [Streptomyces violaceus]|uniref:hypothetical protein n=1 Tax=Streptomyces violaceus TaxID=1936 RepID=UPI00399D679C
MAELGQRARAATPEEAARAGDRVVVSIPPAPYRELSRRRAVGQGRARHRSVRDAPYDEPDDGHVGLVEPRHVVGDHQQHALGGRGQRTTSRLSGRRRCPGGNGMSRKTGGCMCGSHPARPLPPRLSVLSGPFPVRAVSRPNSDRTPFGLRPCPAGPAGPPTRKSLGSTSGSSRPASVQNSTSRRSHNPPTTPSSSRGLTRLRRSKWPQLTLTATKPNSRAADSAPWTNALNPHPR